MTITELEKRLLALEGAVRDLQEQVAQGTTATRPWTREHAGRFANDPLFEEMVRLGKAYRDSLKPGRRRQKQKK
jgi:hypothetical protein